MSGSKAVASLLYAVNNRGRMFDVIEEMKSVDPKKDADKWIDYGTWVSHFETCTSVNSKLGIRAGIKASCLNRDGVNQSADYVLLADFANTVGIVFGSSFSVQSSITSSSTVSASQDSYIGSRLSVSDSSCLNTLNMASSVTVRSFVRLGSFLSVDSSSATGSVL